MKIETEDFDESTVALDTYNSDLNLVIDAARFAAKPLTTEGFAFMWAGARATHGSSKGKFCFEVKILDQLDVSHLPADEPNPHVVRVGFSVESSTMQLGEDPLSYGYGGTGKISTNCQFKDFGGAFTAGDVILGAVNADADMVQIGFAKNGKFLGWAYRVDKSGLKGQALFPHILTKNVSFEVNLGQKEKPYFPLPDTLKDFSFIGCVPMPQREGGTRAPQRREDCEMIMMCGLPGAGKSFWAADYSLKNPKKKYNVLGTNNIIDKMKVMGLPRKRNYHGRWDVLIQMATKCLNKMFEIGSKIKRNYILDQTNVYPTAQRRKMRNFEGFQRKAVVVVPSEAEYKKRCDKRDREEGKEVPDHAVLEMKANFKLPEVNDIFNDVIYTELQKDDSEKLVIQYNEEGKAAVGPPKKQFKSSDGSGSRFDSGRDTHGSPSHGGLPPRGDFDGRGRGGGFRGGFEGGRGGGFDRNRGGFEGGRGGFDRNRGGFEGGRGGFDRNRGGFEGGRGGFDRNRGGFEGGRGGFDRNRGGFESGRGGFDRNRGGFEGGRGGFDRNRGGFEGGRGSGFDRSRGGFEGGRGSFDRNRGGFEGGRGGFDENRGGFDKNRGGFDGSREDFDGNRGGFDRSRGGYDSDRGNFDRNRGGFDGNRGGFDKNRGGRFDNGQGDYEADYSNNDSGFGGRGGFNNNRGGYDSGRGGFDRKRKFDDDRSHGARSSPGGYGESNYSENTGNNFRGGSGNNFRGASRGGRSEYGRGGRQQSDQDSYGGRSGRQQSDQDSYSGRDFNSGGQRGGYRGNNNSRGGGYGGGHFDQDSSSGGYGGGYGDTSSGGGYQSEYSGRDAGGSYGAGSQRSFKKEPGTETSGYGSGDGARNTRASGRASRWSAAAAEAPQASSDYQASPSSIPEKTSYSSYTPQMKVEPVDDASAYGYSSYQPQIKAEPADNSAAYGYDSYSSNTQSYTSYVPPSQPTQGYQTTQPAYGYQTTVPAANQATPQAWSQPAAATTAAPAAAAASTQDHQQQWAQYYQQQSQYYNQYYGQQAQQAGTTPAYGAAYGAK